MTDNKFALARLEEPLSDSVVLTPTGLVFKRQISWDEWLAIGSKLRFFEKTIHWALGDWLKYGEFKWGEKYAQAVAETGFSIDTLKRDQWVASRFPPEKRHEHLSFTHHVHVAGLPESARFTLLDRAESSTLTSKELKATVAVYKAAEAGTLDLNEPAEPPAPEFPIITIPESPHESPIEDATNPVADPDFVSSMDIKPEGLAYRVSGEGGWVYRAWYVTKTMAEDSIKCKRCGETGSVGEVHLVRLERESVPTEKELREHKRYVARLNSTDPPPGLQPGQKYDFEIQTIHESVVMCAKCLWEMSS